MDIFRKRTPAFSQGATAAAQGRKESDNPFVPGTNEFTDWCDGFNDEKGESK